MPRNQRTDLTTRLFPDISKSDPVTVNVCASVGFGSVTVTTPMVVVAGEFSATVEPDNAMFVGAALGSATVPEIVINPVFSPPVLGHHLYGQRKTIGQVTHVDGRLCCRPRGVVRVHQRGRHSAGDGILTKELNFGPASREFFHFYHCWRGRVVVERGWNYYRREHDFHHRRHRGVTDGNDRRRLLGRV